MTDMQDTWAEKTATLYSTDTIIRQAFFDGICAMARHTIGKIEAMLDDPHTCNIDMNYLLEFIFEQSGEDYNSYYEDVHYDGE